MGKPSRAGRVDLKSALPERKPESHKGDFGRLLIVGGGSRYVGAPALVGLAALRAGVDLVTIAAPERAAWAINSISPDLITIKLPCETLRSGVLLEIFAELKRSTALVVGPGLGSDAKTLDAVTELAYKLRRAHPRLPAVFDADGLKAIAPDPRLVKWMPWVLTPHAGEFEALTGSELPPGVNDRAKMVKMAAERLRCAILLKSHVDIIASPRGEVKLNHTGNPGMTVGGTGDVLSGVVGAFLAQGARPFNAAVAGAWACGRAGDLCLRESGYGFLASDVIDKLPQVFREVRKR